MQELVLFLLIGLFWIGAKQDAIDTYLILFLFHFALQNEVLSGFDWAIIINYLDDGVVVPETAG